MVNYFRRVFTLNNPHTRARALLARQGSAGCYGVARQREGSPQNFFFNDTAPTEIYTLSLHDALPILGAEGIWRGEEWFRPARCCSTGSTGSGRLGGAGRTMAKSVAAPSPI